MTSPNLRVLFFSPYYAPHVGGVERFGTTLTAALGELGLEVKIVTMTPSEKPSREAASIMRDLSVSQVLRFMRGVDVVHLSGLSRKGAALARMSGRPAVVTHHGFQAVCPTGVGDCERRVVGGVIVCSHLWKRCSPGRATLIGRRITYGLARRLPEMHVCPSGYLARSIGLPRPAVIANPVPAEFHAARMSRRRLDGILAVGFLGALSQEKGFDLFCDAIELDACSAVAGEPVLRWVVIGDGPLAPRLTRLMMGGRGYVKWIRASLTDVPSTLSEVHVVVVPSRMPEPFCYAAAEALCAGIPVIASRAGALPETLGDLGVFPETVDGAGLLHAVRGIGSWSPGQRRAWEARSEEYVRRFSPVQAAKSYLDVYMRLVERQPRSSSKRPVLVPPVTCCTVG